jgi:S-disulfanyl-L-cysteine oxidoreductase SoxD
MMMFRALFLFCLALAASAQSRNVLAGVYSDAQAARGEAIYETRCAKCHEGADVDGPPLKDAPFIDRWREDTLESLHSFLKANMPQDAPGKLEDAGYRDVVAYILKMNTFPPGAGELTAEGLGATLLVGKDGPKPLPTNALVAATGCLINTGGSWILAGAAEPLRTRNGEEITSEEKKAAETRTLGKLTLQLRNFEDAKPVAADTAGSKALVKGVMNRQAGGDRINVLSYEVVAKGCQP